MKISVTSVPEGTEFYYNGEKFIVVERDYPWVYAKCISEPNDYEGLQIQFGGNCEQVEIEDGTKIIEQYFEKRKWGFQLCERLIENK